jgi:hypothetical protein
MPRVAVATGPISHSSHTATIHSTDYTPAGCRREKSGGVLRSARGLAACRPEGFGRGGDTSPVRLSMRASEFGIEADYCIGPTKLGGLDGDRRRPRRSRLRKLRWQAEMRLVADGIALVYGIEPSQFNVLAQSPIRFLAPFLRAKYSVDENPAKRWGDFLSDAFSRYLVAAKRALSENCVCRLTRFTEKLSAGQGVIG